MRKTVDAFDYAGEICKALKKGVLITTKVDDQVNTMTIGWGHIGIEWGRPIFVAYVRETRYTREMLDNCGEFTINVPVGGYDPVILGFCGTKSGRDVNKIEALNLHLEESVVILFLEIFQSIFSTQDLQQVSLIHCFYLYFYFHLV